MINAPEEPNWRERLGGMGFRHGSGSSLGGRSVPVAYDDVSAVAGSFYAADAYVCETCASSRLSDSQRAWRKDWTNDQCSDIYR